MGSSAQLDTLPWFNVDTIAVEFSTDVDVEKTDLSLWGVTVEQYGFAADPAGFSYDDVNYVATWTLDPDQKIEQPDKLLIDLDGDAGGVTDTGANLLDGDWTDGSDEYPSGDGTAGGDFRFRFNMLPGDAYDRNGEVRPPDWVEIRARLGDEPGDPDYTIFYDVYDGDGEIRPPDWVEARARLGDELPGDEPAPPQAAPDAGTIGVADIRPPWGLLMDPRPDWLPFPGPPTEPITNDEDEHTVIPPAKPLPLEPDATADFTAVVDPEPTEEVTTGIEAPPSDGNPDDSSPHDGNSSHGNPDDDGLEAADVSMIDHDDERAPATSALRASVWDEALLLVAQEMNDRDDDEREGAPDSLLPDLLFFIPE